MPDPMTPEWFAQVEEEIVDPSLEIVDPHHHLWPTGRFIAYSIDDLTADTTSGHRITETVFVECGAGYRTDGPDHLRTVGETEFVAAAADEMRRRLPDAPPISGIVARADLAHPELDALLDAHAGAAGGRLVGIRDSLASCTDPALVIQGRAVAGKFEDEAFRSGVRRLGERGLTYDSWHFHWQNAELAALARACPDTTIVLDHFGTPLGVGPFAERPDAVEEQWRAGLAEAAACDNVVLKLGGMAMPDNGFGWNTAARPPTSDEFVAAQGARYHFAIEQFGPERCMFESNFPVDKLSIGYRVLWNAFKKLAERYTSDERDAMFAATARRTYRL